MPQMLRKNFSLTKISAKQTSIFFACLVIIECLWFYTTPAQRNLGDITAYQILSRRWGLDHISYYPIWLSFLFFGLLSIWFSTSVYTAIYRLYLNHKSDLYRRIDLLFPKEIKLRVLYGIVLSVAMISIHYLFRIKYLLYGDQTHMANSIFTGYLKYLSEGSYAIYHGFDKLFVSWGWSGTTLDSKILSVAYTSIFFGGVFAFNVYQLVYQLFNKNISRLIALVLIIFSGNTFVFYGYNESYGPLFSLIPLSFFLVARMMSTKSLSWLFYLIALWGLWWYMYYLHNMSSLLAPGLLIASLWKVRRYWKIYIPLRLNLFHILIVALGLVAILYILSSYNEDRIEYYTFGGFKIMPLLEPFAPGGFYLLDWRFLWDQLNGALYTSGFNFFILLLIFCLSFKNKIPWTGNILNLSVSAIIVFLFMIVMQKHLGAADIDLMSYPSNFYNVLCAIFLLRILPFYVSDAMTYFRWVGFTVTFNVFHFMLLIGLHASDLSIPKFEDMILADKSKKYVVQTNPETTIAISIEPANFERALYYSGVAYQKYPKDARSYLNYGGKLIMTKGMSAQQQKKGEEILTKCIERFPLYDLSYQTLIYHYDGRKDFKNRDHIIEKLLLAYRYSPEHFKRLKRNLPSFFEVLRLSAAQKNDLKKVKEIEAVLQRLKKQR